MSIINRTFPPRGNDLFIRFFFPLTALESSGFKLNFKFILASRHAAARTYIIYTRARVDILHYRVTHFILVY